MSARSSGAGRPAIAMFGAPTPLPLAVPAPSSRFSHHAAHWIMGITLFMYALLAALLQAYPGVE
jgi:hypothetical protein